MTDTSVIRHLLEVPEALPVLTRWFVEEWGPYYGPEGPGDAEADLRAANQRDQLPICLVALDAAGGVTGTVALRAESIASHRHLTPWLAALLVAPEHRRRGIGTALIAAIEGRDRGAFSRNQSHPLQQHDLHRARRQPGLRAPLRHATQ